MASSQRYNRQCFQTTSSRHTLTCITGYFQPLDAPRYAEEDTEADEEADDVDNDALNADVSDANVFSNSAVNIATKELKKSTVNFKDCKSGKVHIIKGQFPLIDPWWCATVYVDSRKQVMASPFYRLRTDDGVVSEKHVLLLMTKCQVDDEIKKLFCEAIRERSLEKTLSFDTMDQYLELLLKTKKYEGVAQEIICRLENGLPAILVRKAQEFLDLFQILPRLLPRQFKQLVENLDEQKLLAVQTALLTEPWIFGFWRIISKRFKISYCEASLNAFYSSDIIDSVPPTPRDALHIYNELKTICRNEGHTYVTSYRLKNLCNTKDLQISDWKAARSFLIDFEVTVEEKQPNASSRIYLYKYWSAEKNIAEFFCDLRMLHQTDPWKFQIDFERELFAKVRTDSDQMKAAELIGNEPITVLLGKGGCGKTEVVSCVFKFVMELMEIEKNSNIDESTIIDAVVAYENLLSPSMVDTEISNEGSSCSVADETDLICQLPNMDGIQEETVRDKASVDIQPLSEKKDQLLNEASHNKHENSVSVVAESYKDSKCSLAMENEVKCPEILLVAPTGKAAQLLGRRTGLPAYTLHTVYLTYFAWRRRTEKCDYKFGSVRALVVDEGSLVAVSTFNNLISALPTVQKIVILGDIHQLPSIEPGRLLYDLFCEMTKLGGVVELKTNHRAESQCIVDNASRITSKIYPIADSQRHFHIIELPEHDKSISNARDMAVRKLFKDELLKDDKTSQFIAFRRSDCEAINEICCQHYVKHPIKNSKGKAIFQIGDKICCTRNGAIGVEKDDMTKDALNEMKKDATNEKKQDAKKEEKRFCNGEIFFIDGWHEVKDKSKTTTTVTLLEPQLNVRYRVDWNFLNGKCKMRHAWARTIHTFQGSEAQTIVYVVGHAMHQTWQHVYTAVTRGRCEVIIITQKLMLKWAIKTDPPLRHTSLRDKLEVLFQSLDGKQSKDDDNCESTFELAGETVLDVNSDVEDINACDSSTSSHELDRKEQSLQDGQRMLSTFKTEIPSSVNFNGASACFVLEECIDELPDPDRFGVPSPFDLDCNISECSQWSGNYFDSDELSLEDASGDELVVNRIIGLENVIDQDEVAAPFDATVCEFSEWSESLERAVNETMIAECLRVSSVAKLDSASNNNFKPSSSFDCEAATHSPESPSILVTIPTSGVNGGQLFTPKRSLGPRDESSEPPALRPRRDAPVGDDTGVSPLRRSLGSRLSLS